MANKFNYEEAALSPTGDLEMTKNLYETGLQNVYDDYQKNVANLGSQEKRQLEDAHFIREMSKKYLGEYASNTGMKDVSGNLLDIYGSYQKNIGDITRNFDSLEMNLQQEYQGARNEAMNNIMATQYGIEVAQMEEATQGIVHDIQTGNTGGVSGFDYLEQNKGNMTPENYRAIHGALYTEQVQDITQAISTGFYGYDEQGELITDGNKFLEKFAGNLNPNDLKTFQDQIQFNEQLKVTQPEDIVVNSLKDPNSPAFNPNYDPTISYTGNDNIGPESDIYQIDIGNGMVNNYVQVLDDVNNDMTAKNPVFSDELFENYENTIGGSPTQDDIMNYRGTFYAFKDGGWHRLTANTEPDQKVFRPNSSEYSRGMLWAKDTLTIGDKKFKENRDDARAFDMSMGVKTDYSEATGKGKNESAVVEAFKQLVSTNFDKKTHDDTVFYANGEYWVVKGEMVYPMRRVK